MHISRGTLSQGKTLMKCKQFALLDVLLGDAKHLALCHYTWVKSRKWAVLPTRVQCSWGDGTQGWIPGLGES